MGHSHVTLHRRGTVSSAEINRNLMKCPGAGLRADQKLETLHREGTRPSPASLETLMKVSMHMMVNITTDVGIFKAACRKRRATEASACHSGDEASADFASPLNTPSRLLGRVQAKTPLITPVQFPEPALNPQGRILSVRQDGVKVTSRQSVLPTRRAQLHHRHLKPAA